MRTKSVLVLVLALVALFAATPAWAQGFLGWMPLADVHVSSTCGQRACEAELPTSWRYPTYAVATDAPLGITLTGRLAFVCEGGSEQMALLPSPSAPGAVVTVRNPCPGSAATRVTARIESVSIPGGNEARGANLRFFGGV